MAGYIGISMSNNAHEAYKKGFLPASKIYAGLPGSLVEKYCRSDEWHHTSMRYNCTSFYDPELVKATFGIIEHEKFKPNEEAKKAWAQYKAEKRQRKVENASSTEETFDDCIVRWGKSTLKGSITWREEHGCQVVVKGAWCIITLPDGTQMRKKKSSKHFSFKATSAQK